MAESDQRQGGTTSDPEPATGSARGPWRTVGRASPRVLGALRVAAVVAGLPALVVVLALNARASETEAYDQVTREIRKLETFEDALLQDVLKRRFDLLDGYAAIDRSMAAMFAVNRRLEDSVLVELRDDPAIERALAGADQALGRERALLESFKAADQAFRGARIHGAGSADDLARHEQAVRDAIVGLIAVTDENRMESLQTEFRRHHERAARRANLSRVLLSLLSLALVLVVGHTLLQLRRKRAALGVALDRVREEHAVAEGRRQELEALSRDLEERVRDRTEELAAANGELLRLVRTKDEFLANMSHEIRTPLTSVLGYAELLLEEGLPAEELRSYSETIRRNGRHLLEVVNDILDLSKFEAGMMKIERRATAVVDLVQQVMATVQLKADEKHLGFELEVADDVPAVVETDAVRLRQILVNLVGNAVKFTEGGRVQVSVGAEPSGDAWHVRITDTGIGMTGEQMTRLFTPFSQADASTTRRFGGTGLGLAISQRLAGLLGGAITVQSTAGQGSTFTLRMPIGTTGVVPAAAPPPAPAAPPRPAAYHVLLAEDTVDNQVLLRALLEQLGAEVTIADTGRAAVDSAMDAKSRRRPFDIVFMDMQMPELDGYAATEALRRLGFGTPVVALTARAMDGDRERCLAAGCDDYLTKPVTSAVLETALLAHLGPPAAGRGGAVRADARGELR
jgi:signal transduction histidine kinase/ActR/RegA family two-component response regulator